LATFGKKGFFIMQLLLQRKFSGQKTRNPPLFSYMLIYFISATPRSCSLLPPEQQYSFPKIKDFLKKLHVKTY